MMLRKTRWLTAGLLAASALLVSPARSQAGIEILIQEVNSSGTTVGAAQYFTGAGVTGVTTSHFSNIGINISSSSGPSNLLNTLTSGVTARPGATFDPAFGLRVWVTDNGFQAPPGGFALLRNSNSQSSGVSGGLNTVTNNSSALNVPTTTPSPNTSGPPTGSALGGPTLDASSAVSVLGDSGSSSTTTSGIASLPSAFAIQQTITIRATPLPGQTISLQSTLGGTATSSLQANAPTPPGVPAPGGLLLALIGLPLLGARRLRKKA